MHDWGDMLVHSGFAEPVMDMERLTLTFSNPAALLDDLRALGRNLSVGRFPQLRTQTWRRQLEAAIEEHLPRTDDGRLVLTMELIYGHAFKSAPKQPRGGDATSTVSVDEMRSMLRSGRR
jgi:malonyl-CoA O-methyltransferase